MKAYTTQPVAVILLQVITLDDVPVFDAFSDEKVKSTANARYAGVAIELQDYPEWHQSACIWYKNSRKRSSL